MAEFSRTVPERYGGGEVEVWDTGCWYADGDVKDAYDKGRLSICLRGERMRGNYTLVRFYGRRNGDTWQLIREREQVVAQRTAGEAKVTMTPAVSGSDAPLAQVREILAHANVAVDPAGVRVVGRFCECLGDASTRDRARKALQDAGIYTSLVRGRLFFPLRLS